MSSETCATKTLVSLDTGPGDCVLVFKRLESFILTIHSALSLIYLYNFEYFTSLAA